jgi:hypothetical protein
MQCGLRWLLAMRSIILQQKRGKRSILFKLFGVESCLQQIAQFSTCGYRPEGPKIIGATNLPESPVGNPQASLHYLS